MSDTPRDETRQSPGGRRVGSWFGAAAGAFGLGVSITIVNLGAIAIMDAGGFVASGGPYEVAHPIPQGFWILPVAFVGMWVFPAIHAVFSSRIKGFGLVYATWCAVWVSIGATTLWFGFDPPRGSGLAWGWLVMGAVFLLVGLGSATLYIGWLRSPDREPSIMPLNQRRPYALMIAVALAGGGVAGLLAFAAVAT